MNTYFRGFSAKKLNRETRSKTSTLIYLSKVANRPTVFHVCDIQLIHKLKRSSQSCLYFVVIQYTSCNMERRIFHIFVWLNKKTMQDVHVKLNPRFLWQKQHLTKKNNNNLLASEMDFNPRNKLVKCYIWCTALCAAETWTLRKVDQKYLESSEMWCLRKMEKISCTDHVRNEGVLHGVRQKRREKWVFRTTQPSTEALISADLTRRRTSIPRQSALSKRKPLYMRS